MRGHGEGGRRGREGLRVAAEWLSAHPDADVDQVELKRDGRVEIKCYGYQGDGAREVFLDDAGEPLCSTAYRRDDGKLTYVTLDIAPPPDTDSVAAVAVINRDLKGVNAQ